METKRIDLNDGFFIEVLARDYPFVQEWLWTYDTTTGLIYRLENGRGVLLYHELLKRSPGDENFVSLGDQATEVLFGQVAMYEDMLNAFADRVEAAQGSGILLPDATDALSYSLTSALYLYFQWLQGGKHYYLEMNMDRGEAVGTLREAPLKRPLPADMRYANVRAWMFGEYTGQVEDFEGHGPEPLTFADAVEDAITLAYARLFEEINPGRSMEEITAYFEELDLSLDELMNYTFNLIEFYPIPEY